MAQSSLTRRLNVITVSLSGFLQLRSAGSNAGLMCGVMHKWPGHNVHILEQYPSSERKALAAAPTFLKHVQPFFRKHDPACGSAKFDSRREGPATEPEFACEEDDITSRTDAELGAISYRLRANSDGLVSNFCPSPPPLDGR